MYQVFHLDVAEVIWMFHNMHVANVCFQCFMRMLQLFHLNVAYVLQWLHTYFQVFQCFFNVSEVMLQVCSAVLFVYCKCFICMF